MNSTSFSLCSSNASAPGKVILYGEHAVVHGSKAIAASLSDLRVVVDIGIYRIFNDDKIIVIFEDLVTTIKINVVDWKRIYKNIVNSDSMNNTTSSPNEKVQMFLFNEFNQSRHNNSANQGMMTVSYIVANILPDSFFNSNDSLSLNIRVKASGLPIGAGLGSSAAFKLSDSDSGLQTVNQKLLKLRLSGSPNSKVTLVDDITESALVMKNPSKEELQTINNWAYAAEVLLHGNPSGLDNTTSCFGGILEYSKNKDDCSFEFLQNCPSFHILLINSKVPRSTKQLVMSVQGLRESFPAVVDSIFGAINEISNDFIKLVQSFNNGDIELSQFNIKIGTLLEVNHHLLCSLGVGHQSLDQIHDSCKSFNFPCKLTGAGGGGCAISLIPNEKHEDVTKLVILLESFGYNCFHSLVGGQGVMFS